MSRAEAARLNGAKSRGPQSAEGKLNSANGPLKHGGYSFRVVIDGESPEGYIAFKSTYVNLFLPTDTFEAECVEAMVSARWRIRRIECSESRNLNIAIERNVEENEKNFDVLDILHERAIAIQLQLPSIDAHTRVEERLHRIYHRNYKLLAAYRKNSGRAIPEESSQPAAAATPAPVASNLTEEPKPAASEQPSAASILSKIAVILILFALLLAKPVRAAVPPQHSDKLHLKCTDVTSLALSPAPALPHSPPPRSR
jgi:hypothetical protein